MSADDVHADLLEFKKYCEERFGDVFAQIRLNQETLADKIEKQRDSLNKTIENRVATLQMSIKHVADKKMNQINKYFEWEKEFLRNIDGAIDLKIENFKLESQDDREIKELQAVSKSLDARLSALQPQNIDTGKIEREFTNIKRRLEKIPQNSLEYEVTDLQERVSFLENRKQKVQVIETPVVVEQ